MLFEQDVQGRKFSNTTPEKSHDTEKELFYCFMGLLFQKNAELVGISWPCYLVPALDSLPAEQEIHSKWLLG